MRVLRVGVRAGCMRVREAEAGCGVQVIVWR